MPRTFLATLHYDGTEFVGWQRQRVGRTVQQELETVLERLAGMPVRVHAAGRTDTGVHAIGMAVSCVLPDRWTPDSLRRALNALLPSDCYVAGIREARTGFHARKCAMERRYQYLIGTDEEAWSPFRRRYEWPLGQPLDVDRLSRIGQALVGEHDFQSVAIKNAALPHTRCRIASLEWTSRPGGQGVRLEIAADRFLHHMVRMLVATMVDIALDRRAETDMTRLLAREAGVRSSPPAPPQGLYFVLARYPEEWFAMSEAAA